MRNPDRLDELYKELHDLHKQKYPDLRFGQFMSFFFGQIMSEHNCNDIFYIEDDEWVKWIKQWRDKENAK